MQINKKLLLMVKSAQIVNYKQNCITVIIHYMTKWIQYKEKIIYIILMNLINIFDFSYLNKFNINFQ